MISKDKKENVVKDLIDRLKRQRVVIFSDYTGLTVNKIQDLRKNLRDAGIDYQVAKKTLIDLAFKKAGIKDIKVRELTGQVALTFGYQDEILPAKILYNFSKENESLKILAGVVDGDYLDNQAVISLARLSSRQELLAQLVGGVGAPLSGLINVLEGNLRKLVYCLKNIGREV